MNGIIEHIRNELINTVDNVIYHAAEDKFTGMLITNAMKIK